MIAIASRAKPRVQILRGWDLVNTNTLNQVHPVKAGVTVKSGQVIQRTWNATTNAYEWELGCSAGKQAFIAFQDSTESDVMNANGLTGISLSGDYEIQTGYFAAGIYNVDVLLSYDGTTGNLKVAATGNPVIGRVSKIRGAKQLNNPALQVYENSETAPGNSSVIIFETATGVAPATP